MQSATEEGLGRFSPRAQVNGGTYVPDKVFGLCSVGSRELALAF